MGATVIVNEAIEDYLLRLAPSRSPIQQQIEANSPAAIVGPLEGQFLYLLAKISVARQVLEIGTAIGYSALWILQALAAVDGHLITIEREPARAQEARANFQRAGYDHLVEVREGDAFSVLATVDGPFDLIFIDILRNFGQADEATKLFDQCYLLLRPTGLLIADNVLVDGEVIQANPAPRVQGIMEWNRRVSQESGLETVILPLRDGIAVSRRKG